MGLMQAFTFGLLVSSVLGQADPSSKQEPAVAPSLTTACMNAQQLGQCRSVFDSSVSAAGDNMEEVCKSRLDYAQCTDQALCACQYPSDSFMLSQAYKEIMRNLYYFKRDNCESYKLVYPQKPGITCVDRDTGKDNNFPVVQNTTGAPVIQGLIQKCPALETCFKSRDAAAIMSTFNKNFTAFCGTFTTFFKCFESKVCECQLKEEPAADAVNNFEKKEYVAQCKTLSEFSAPMLEVNCGGTCSLKQPGVQCDMELQANVATATSPEQVCRHMVTYINCYSDLVCQCGFYHRQDIYTTVAMSRFAFDTKQNCTQYSGVVFPAGEKGFPCPGDKNVTADKKVIKLTSATEPFALTEEVQCPGVVRCMSLYDERASAALNIKDLYALCRAVSDEIVCLENITCACGTLHSHFSQVLASKRQTLDSVCGTSVIPPTPVINCFDKRLCNNTAPLQPCDAVLGRPAGNGEDPHRTACINLLDKAACVRQISCGCGLTRNGSAPSAVDTFKVLTDNALSYDAFGCSAVTGPFEIQPGFPCPGDTPEDAAKKKLVVAWQQVPVKVQKSSECPALRPCYDQDVVIYAESLYTTDPRRVCRNQVNTLKCEERAYCGCGKSETEKHTIQMSIAAHNYNCSKYAAHSNFSSCDETSWCQKARTSDICLDRMSKYEDNSLQCLEWANYLNCAYDVTCTCGLLYDPARAERAYVNVARTMHFLYTSPRCTQVINDLALRVPMAFLTYGFECFDKYTALPIPSPVIQSNLSTSPQLKQWSSKCPTVLDCADKYDNDRVNVLGMKEYVPLCFTSMDLIQCSRLALCSCNASSDEVKSLEAFLVSLHGDCTEVVNLGSKDCDRIGEGGGVVDDRLLKSSTPPYDTTGNGTVTKGIDCCDKPSQIVKLFVIFRLNNNNNNNNNNERRQHGYPCP
ncbi:uncharacterized protein LOC131936876 [Physella acuta]|uniref:uncharacterized protein LOC131936876 n=1 Tax=Physella acuta TaxID=109671 RepID=UPI0027DBD60E|nr:uncharacterized protein LOC131936876 [Physella acuta]